MEKVSNFKWLEDAKIYQVFIDRFHGYKKEYGEDELRKGFLYGNLKALISKLDYIQSLNFNVIWINPFFVNQINGYHGYHVTNFNHVDPRFALGESKKNCKDIGNPRKDNDMNNMTEADNILVDLINEVHKRNMKIMMDMVPNHVHSTHPFFIEAKENKESKYYNWFYFFEKKEKVSDKSDKKINNKTKDNEKEKIIIDYLKFLNVGELPKLNLDYKECGDYIIQVTKRYLKLGIDAIRLDHIIGPSKTYLKRFAEEIHKDYPNVPLIGEILPVAISSFSDTILGLNKELLEKMDTITLDSLKAMDQSFYEYNGYLDGILDYTFTYLIDLFIKNKLSENELKKHLNDHYLFFEKTNLFLLKQLDSHDIDRILFRCGNDRNKFRKSMEYLYHKFDNRNDPLVLYYGTEDFMTQDKTMEGEPYGDFRVRQPMNFSFQWTKTFFKLKNE